MSGFGRDRAPIGMNRARTAPQARRAHGRDYGVDHEACPAINSGQDQFLARFGEAILGLLLDLFQGYAALIRAL